MNKVYVIHGKVHDRTCEVNERWIVGVASDRLKANAAINLCREAIQYDLDFDKLLEEKFPPSSLLHPHKPPPSNELNLLYKKLGSSHSEERSPEDKVKLKQLQKEHLDKLELWKAECFKIDLIIKNILNEKQEFIEKQYRLDHPIQNNLKYKTEVVSTYLLNKIGYTVETITVDDWLFP